MISSDIKSPRWVDWGMEPSIDIYCQHPNHITVKSPKILQSDEEP